jgi:hypothetical protein
VISRSVVGHYVTFTMQNNEVIKAHTLPFLFSARGSAGI